MPRFHPKALALVLGLVAACDAQRFCTPGSTLACTCDGDARNGLATCNSAGSAFGFCDCSEAACAPKAASQRCEGDHVFDFDACGNRDPAPARACVCPCVEGATTCPDWSEPATLTPAASCNDASACLNVEHVHCAPLEGFWVHGYRATNDCDFAIRCYFYAYASHITPVDGGYTEEAVTECVIPNQWPRFDPGQDVFGWGGVATEAECRSQWDSPTVTELTYHVCVRADDPAATCLPDTSVRSCTTPELAPVCRGG